MRATVQTDFRHGRHRQCSGKCHRQQCFLHEVSPEVDVIGFLVLQPSPSSLRYGAYHGVLMLESDDKRPSASFVVWRTAHIMPFSHPKTATQSTKIERQQVLPFGNLCLREASG